MDTPTQKSIKVDVQFYDDNERSLLLAYPTAGKIEEIVRSPIEVDSSEFLAYYLFYRKRPGKPGYRNYDEIRGNIKRSLDDLDGWVVFNGTSISSALDATPQDIHITERVGEAIGLAVTNRIHEMTAADWDRIPVKAGRGAPPVFDYHIASDGNHLVQVESKGSCVDNNEDKSPAVRNHKLNIKTKKADIRAAETANNYPYAADLRYGTITVFDRKPNSVIKCWLVDPPATPGVMPHTLQLLNRLRFMLDWISLLGPRSQLTSALSTRVADLEHVTDSYELDKVPLMRRGGDTFEDTSHPPHPMARVGYQTSFFINRSRVIDGPAGGLILQLSDKYLFFLGFREEIVRLAMNQDFKSILSYRNPSGPVDKTVLCTFTERQFERLRLPEAVTRQTRKNGPYYTFSVNGLLYYSQEGLVFGLLPL